MYNRIITMKNSIEFPQKKIENRTTIRSSNLTSNTPKRIEIRISRAICPPMFIVALFTVSKRKTTFTSIECCCSVARSCSTLCDPMDCSTPGFPVLHYLPEFAQTHVHWVDNAIQPSQPLLPTSPTLNPTYTVSFLKSDTRNIYLHIPQDWKRSVFIPIPKKGNAKECSSYHTIALISHTSKVMLKIL